MFSVQRGEGFGARSPRAPLHATPFALRSSLWHGPSLLSVPSEKRPAGPDP